jgi:squalene/oxidosqualene cyclase-like protein
MTTVTDASGLSAAVDNLCSLQQPDGRWEGEMVWNTMLLSQYVLTHRMVGDWPLPSKDRDGILRHYERTRNPDGSWPFHYEAPGSVYVTTLAYVALRVMGLPPEAPLVHAAHSWLRAQPGGVLAIPTWGRLWLAMLGLYDYEGINPIVPESVLFPRWVPLHPDRLYCHTRYAYLALSYLYGRRAQFDLGPLTEELRRELYDLPYESIAFARQRHQIAETEVHVRPSSLLRLGYNILARYERRPLHGLRQLALRRCLARIEREQAASAGHGLSPVNGLLGCLVLASDGRPKSAVTAALKCLEAWRWEDATDGIRIVGARSLAWDTAFAMRALLSAPTSPTVNAALGNAYHWLVGAQVDRELDGGLRRGRDPVRGGWCFSYDVHRWPVADCTAEALSAILMAHGRPELQDVIEPRITTDRLIAAVEFILYRQNPDGGWGTYERTRAPRLVERLNPSEMYANCMTDYSHVECSASCISALARFRAAFPDHAPRRIAAAIGRGLRFLRSRQRPDGSYPAAWGINFTYAAFFAMDAFITADTPESDPAVADAVAWLIGTQKDDGGWGEHHLSCRAGRYVEHPHSQAAMTAWALLAITRGASHNHPAVRRGTGCLLAMQQRGQRGGWPQQSASGVFFATAVLDYRLYKEIFPTWALAAARRED